MSRERTIEKPPPLPPRRNRPREHDVHIAEMTAEGLLSLRVHSNKQQQLAEETPRHSHEQSRPSTSGTNKPIVELVDTTREEPFSDKEQHQQPEKSR